MPFVSPVLLPRGRAIAPHCFAVASIVLLLLAAAPAARGQTPSERPEATESEAVEANDSEGLEAPELANAAGTEVVVLGRRPNPGASAREPGVSGSVIERERLELPGKDAAEALREAPGVQITRLGGLGAHATASVRGATGAQTPVYLAGVRINDEVGGVANLAEVPLFLVDRIEVYRSHAPREASSLGIGGAIFFEPRQFYESKLSVSGTLGSFGTRGAQSYAAVRDGDRRLVAGVNFAGANNDYTFHDSRGTLFEDDDGGLARLQNADATQKSLWLVASDQLGPAKLELVVHHASREQGAPKLALVPTESARARFSRNLFLIRSDIPVDDWNGDLSLRTSAIQAVSTLDDPQGELGLMTRRTSTPGERLQQVVQARQRPHQDVVLIEQLSLSTERLRRFDGPVNRSALAARRFSIRTALSADIALTEELSASATVALRCFDTSTGGLQACSDTEPSGRAGARYQLGDIEFYANAGRYYRLPTLTELYGAGLLVRGNRRLSPEAGKTVEIGTRYQVSRPGRPPLLWVDLAGFARNSTDLVTYVRTAQGYLHPVNRDTARTLGGELAAGVHPVSGLQLEGHLNLLDSRDTSPTRVTKNDILPFTSRAIAFVRGRYEHIAGLKALHSAAVGASYSFQSSRFADPAGLGVIPAQSFVDLEAEVTALDRAVVARARVSNVFDAERFDVVGFPLPGRSVFFSSEVTW